MLVALVAGAGWLVLPALVLVLVAPSHQSPAKHRSDNHIVRLLNTPQHQLDDAAIWEVAQFLSNYTSVPSEGKGNRETTSSLFITSSVVPNATFQSVGWSRALVEIGRALFDAPDLKQAGPLPGIMRTPSIKAPCAGQTLGSEGTPPKELLAVPGRGCALAFKIYCISYI